LSMPNQAYGDPLTVNQKSQSIELLTFSFNEVIFGLDILKVEEIHGYENPYSIVSTNNAIKQSITVRGNKIQMIDLSVKFGFPTNSSGDPKNVIILNALERQFGIAVDGVTEVITTNKSLISMPSQHDRALSGLDFATGLIKVDENILVVLDLAKLITRDDLISSDGLRDE